MENYRTQEDCRVRERTPRSSETWYQEDKEAVAKSYLRKRYHHSASILPPSLLSDSLSSQITGWVTDTALCCWNYGTSYTLNSQGKLHSHKCPGQAHSPGTLCRLLLCPSHSLRHSCPQKGGNRWAWCTGSLPGSKDHIAYRRTWPPPWRLRPPQVPCILQTHTRKLNSHKFSKEGSNQSKTQVHHFTLFIAGNIPKSLNGIAKSSETFCEHAA